MRRNKTNNKRRTAKKPSYNAVMPVPTQQPYQRAIHLFLPGTDQLITTNGIGTVQLAIPVNVQAAIPGFGIKWGVTFDEYCIIKTVHLIEPLTSSTGVTRFYFDENSSGLPIPASAQVREGNTVINNSGSAPPVSYRNMRTSGAMMKWSARDVADLQWVSGFNNPVSIAYLKVYTDATLGSPNSTTLFLIRSYCTVRFRMPI